MHFHSLQHTKSPNLKKNLYSLYIKIPCVQHECMWKFTAIYQFKLSVMQIKLKYKISAFLILFDKLQIQVSLTRRHCQLKVMQLILIWETGFACTCTQ